MYGGEDKMSQPSWSLYSDREDNNKINGQYNIKKIMHAVKTIYSR